MASFTDNALLRRIADSIGAGPGSGGGIIVDGLSTLTEQEAQTALLTTIDTDTGAISAALGNLATAANQATLNGHVDGIEAKLDLLFLAPPALHNTATFGASSSGFSKSAPTSGYKWVIGSIGFSFREITATSRIVLTNVIANGAIEIPVTSPGPGYLNLGPKGVAAYDAVGYSGFTITADNGTDIALWASVSEVPV